MDSERRVRELQEWNQVLQDLRQWELAEVSARQAELQAETRDRHALDMQRWVSHCEAVEAQTRRTFLDHEAYERQLGLQWEASERVQVQWEGFAAERFDRAQIEAEEDEEHMVLALEYLDISEDFGRALLFLEEAEATAAIHAAWEGIFYHRHAEQLIQQTYEMAQQVAYIEEIVVEQEEDESRKQQLLANRLQERQHQLSDLRDREARALARLKQLSADADF
jgi:hypothetical protein